MGKHGAYWLTFSYHNCIGPKVFSDFGVCSIFIDLTILACLIQKMSDKNVQLCRIYF